MRQYGTTDVAHFIRLRVVIRQGPDCKEQSGSLFLSKRFGLADTAPFAADSKYRVKYELGAAVIFVRFSTMGITCGKTLLAACCFT